MNLFAVGVALISFICPHGIAWAHELRKSHHNFAEAAPYQLLCIEPAAIPTSAVILLHGLTGNATEMLPFAFGLQARGLQTTKFILLQAPRQRIDFLNTTAPSWFNLVPDPLSPGIVDAAVSEAELTMVVNNVVRLAGREHFLHGISPRRIALFGFSQGGSVALAAYLRGRWGAVVSLSSFLQNEEAYPQNLSNQSISVPLLMFHGDADEIVSVSDARRSRDLIRNYGRSVQYREFRGEGHFLQGVSETILESSARLLKEVLQ